MLSPISTVFTAALNFRADGVIIQKGYKTLRRIQRNQNQQKKLQITAFIFTPGVKSTCLSLVDVANVFC